MASGNMKDIKRRVKSVESTMQITKAMELVASSKLRKAKQRAEEARPFFEAQYELMCKIAGETEGFSTVFTRRREIKNRLFIVIAGDRGMAGGYNTNIIKLVTQAHEKDKVKPKIIAIGKKAVDYFTKHGYEVVAEYPGLAETIKTADAADISRMALDMFTEGAVDEIQIFYTQFISALVQTATQMGIIPVNPPVGNIVPDNKAGTNYDPSPEAVFNRVIPRLTASIIICAVNESYASEQGARRTAMENATDNAEEMIGTLSLLYNRARQEKITNELNEIVSGANAL
ncbi:MAG: ATP synthase F1 subunit gamma [Ruminiclostridium sp.]|nr:ATP synthase F1 subunit gamma [Ruminiclostridium sp.]